MIGRKAVIGLSLLSALLFCAFAAQSASAALETSDNTTAFTCVSVPGTGDFEDEHCDNTDPQGDGNWDHELIPLDTTTEIDATNEKVTNSTKDSEPAVLSGTVFGVKSEISCATVKNKTDESTIHNTEPVKGQHTFTGTVVVQYSKCTVLKPAKCAVSEPIVATATLHGVEGLEGPTGEKNAMGVEFVGHGENETFATIEYKNKGEEKCALNGQKFKVQGKVIATSGPTTTEDQEDPESGATLVFTPEHKMQELTLGGNPATFTSIVTPKMAGAGGKAITLTTTTLE